MSTAVRPIQGPSPSDITKMAVEAGRRSTTGGGILRLSSIPPILRPVARAYALGYASAVAPRLLTLILQRLTRRKRRRLSQGRDADRASFRSSALHIIRTGFDVQRFPTFCAVLVGGSTLLLVRSSLTLPTTVDMWAHNCDRILGTSEDHPELHSQRPQPVHEAKVSDPDKLYMGRICN